MFSSWSWYINPNIKETIISMKKSVPKPVESNPLNNIVKNNHNNESLKKGIRFIYMLNSVELQQFHYRTVMCIKCLMKPLEIT